MDYPARSWMDISHGPSVTFGSMCFGAKISQYLALLSGRKSCDILLSVRNLTIKTYPTAMELRSLLVMSLSPDGQHEASPLRRSTHLQFLAQTAIETALATLMAHSHMAALINATYSLAGAFSNTSNFAGKINLYAIARR